MDFRNKQSGRGEGGGGGVEGGWRCYLARKLLVKIARFVLELLDSVLGG